MADIHKDSFTIQTEKTYLICVRDGDKAIITIFDKTPEFVIDTLENSSTVHYSSVIVADWSMVETDNNLLQDFLTIFESGEYDMLYSLDIPMA